MKTSLLIFVLCMAAQIVYGQKLWLDTVDHETKQVIKETEWIKVNGAHRKHLQVKLKRIGDEVRLYCTVNRPNNEGATNERDHIEILLSNSVRMDVALVVLPDSVNKVLMEEKIRNRINGTVRQTKLTDVPDAITSEALTSEQLSILANNAILQMDVYLDGIKDIIPIKEKYRDALTAQVALMR